MRQQRPSHVDPSTVNPKLMSTDGGLRGASGRQSVRDLSNFGEFGRRGSEEQPSETRRRTDQQRRRSSSRQSEAASARVFDAERRGQQPRGRTTSAGRSRSSQRPAPEYDTSRIRRIPRSRAGDSSRGGTVLAPARDTGLAVRRGADRQRDAERRKTVRTALFVVLFIVALIAAFIGWRAISDRAVEGGQVVSLAALQSPNAAATSAIASTPAQDPTPVFATYGDLSFRTPVPLSALTEVLFHQASYTYALDLATPMPIATLSTAANKVGTSRDISAQPKGADAVLVGSALQVWRSGRSGKPDTAVDVGAAAGTEVYAPLSGTVVKVKQYLLYGKYDDTEVHIQPTGHPELDLVLIHMDGVTIAPGTQVIAGVTRIGQVRLLSNKIKDQLADYTPGTGDHVHVQLNDVHNAAYKGLEGAITVTQTAGSK